MTSAWQVKKVGNVTARIRTANIHTIYRNGRPIEVGTIEIEGLSPLRRKRAKDTFLLLTLLAAMLRGHGNLFPPIDTDRVLHWSNYSAKAVALIQARGMPIDVVMWNLVQENEAAVITELLRRLDPSQGTDNPIYTPEGEFGYARFERWLASVGVVAWPRLDSGALDLEGDTFRLMSHIPGVEGLHALRDSLRVIVGSKLPIGRDGRNRPSLFPFGNRHRPQCPPQVALLVGSEREFFCCNLNRIGGGRAKHPAHGSIGPPMLELDGDKPLILL